MPNAQNFFSQEDKDRIKAAILKAELDTSGEIRVHIENNCKGDVLDRSAYLFDYLKINETEQRNGVLFYLAIKDRKFAILGDTGINQVVEEDFWEGIKAAMEVCFKKGDFVLGLEQGISSTGLKLKKHFPYHRGDINELSDDISFG